MKAENQIKLKSLRHEALHTKNELWKRCNELASKISKNDSLKGKHFDDAFDAITNAERSIKQYAQAIKLWEKGDVKYECLMKEIDNLRKIAAWDVDQLLRYCFNFPDEDNA